MTISASVTVQDGAGSPIDPTGVGADVTPSNTITIRLASTSGVDIWQLSIIGTDETISAPTLTINSTTKTATYTCTASTGTCVLFRSRAISQNGTDPVTKRSPYVVDYQFAVHTLISGKRVGAVNETVEANASFGTAAKINPGIRSGGGGSAPSGTGIAHVSAGSFVSPASVIVGADCTANLAITTSVAAGTNPAATGPLRIPYQGYLVSRDAAGTGDFPLISNDNGGFVTLGDASVNNGYVFKQVGGGTMFFRFNATDALTLVFNAIKAAVPIIGDASNSSPYGVHGDAAKTLGSGSTYTEVAANYCKGEIVYDGTPGATCTITYPVPAAGAGYRKWLTNSVSGGFSLVFTVGTGGTITIANGKTACLSFKSTGVTRETADV